MLRGFVAGSALLGAGLASPGCITADVQYRETRGSRLGEFVDDRKVVEVISTNVGGKNVYIPGTIVLSEGEGRVLSFFNTTDTPHGMTIEGLGIQEILPPGKEHPVALPELEGGNVYPINCHLHPPHRGATLVVLPR